MRNTLAILKNIKIMMVLLMILIPVQLFSVGGSLFLEVLDIQVLSSLNPILILIFVIAGFLIYLRFFIRFQSIYKSFEDGNERKLDFIRHMPLYFITIQLLIAFYEIYKRFGNYVVTNTDQFILYITLIGATLIIYLYIRIRAGKPLIEHIFVCLVIYFIYSVLYSLSILILIMTGVT